ncbi:RDD family protein [Rhodococcus oryzae]|uniref:RDD family protein n=1 Tax=Rhodococcus oryzae TaxID=2571143 RepID=UPI003798FB97
MTTGGFDQNQNQPGEPSYPTPPQFDDQVAGGAFPGGAEPGSLGVRFGARLVDYILVGVVTWILLIAFGVTDNIAISGLVSGILTFAYFVVFDIRGWTPGKKMLGLTVRGPGGGNPTPQQASIREAFNLLNIIPFIGGLLSLIAVIVIAVTINSSPTKQGKHDELAGGTQVVRG